MHRSGVAVPLSVRGAGKDWWARHLSNSRPCSTFDDRQNTPSDTPARRPLCLGAGMTRYTLYSGGQGSFRAAMIDRAQHPDHTQRLVFTDTLYEDADTYRFLIESAAHVFGRRLNWTVDVAAAPDYRVSPQTPLEEYHGNPEWRAWLADLRESTAIAIPELIWLAEGRDPWEVFRDELFLGNSRADPCSKVLKRQVLDRWRVGACDPAADTFAVGIGDHEAHRFLGGRGKSGLQARMADAGWQYVAPLLQDPAQIEAQAGKGVYSLMSAPLGEIGPAEPRLYGLGYAHNNCGGFCVKGGHAHWQRRQKVHPERYAYDAMMERKMRNFLGTDAATILNDRRGGQRQPMSLDAFALRMLRRPDRLYAHLRGSSGCGCMIDELA